MVLALAGDSTITSALPISMLACSNVTAEDPLAVDTDGI
jgi:hypothetical protein